MRQINRLLPLLLMFLAGCGGSGGTNGTSNGQISVGGGIVKSPVSLSFTKAAMQLGETTTITATVKTAAGDPASGIPVTFTTTAGTLTPSNGVVMTDANGVASIQLTAGTSSGQGQITASATVDNKLSTQIGLFGVNLPPLKLANIQLVGNPPGGAIDFGSSQGISVEVQDASGNLYTAQSVDVIFTSTQATLGKATISSQIASVAGKVSTTYTALTATGQDTITASIAGSSVTIPITVNPLNAGAITFVSATPTTIGLKGMGGVGVQETSKVTFKVLDTSGAPKANQPVSFALNTGVGGLTLSTLNGSTAADGTVSTIVQAGVIATPVRVTARTTVNATTLSTQSDQLVISTGIPAQDGFSVSSSILNVEGLDFDGVTDKVSVYLSDHFHNPVPDGTAVYFTTSCGSVQPSCLSSGGSCSVTWTSQSPRPSDGRCTVLAYAIGEEAFLDSNGNGVADGACTSVDNGTGLSPYRICGEFTDYSEAFRDDNWDGVRDLGETFIDFNGDGVFNGPSGLFNGILQGSATLAAVSPASKTRHVFMNHHLLITGSTPSTFDFNSTAIDPAIVVCTNLACTSTSVLPVSTTRVLTIKDSAGNPLPAGTQISVTGLSASPSSFVVPDGITTASSSVFTDFSISFTAPTTSGSGAVTVTVKTPRGITTSKGFSFSW